MAAAGVVVTAAPAGTRAEWPVDIAGVVVVVVVVALVASADPVSTAAAAAGASLGATDDALRELTFPPEDVTALFRAERAVDFFTAVESVALDDDELLSELVAEALPAPDAPVSAYATADPLARAAPTPRVTAPAPSHA